MHPSSVSVNMLNFPLTVWKFCGVWPNEKFGCFKWLYTMIFLVFYTIYNLLISINLPKSVADDEFIENLNTLVITVFLQVQVVFVRLNYKKLLHLFQMMHKIENNYFGDMDFDVLAKTAKSAKFLSASMCTVYCFVIQFAIITVLFDNRRVLLWPSYFPFDYKTQSLGYYCAIVYQYCLGMVTAFNAAALTSFAPILYSILRTYIKLLGMKIKAMGWQKYVAADIKQLNEHKIVECLKYYDLIIR